MYADLRNDAVRAVELRAERVEEKGSEVRENVATRAE